MLRLFLKSLIFLTLLKTSAVSASIDCSDPESMKCGSITTRIFLNHASGQDTLVYCSLLEKCTLEQKRCSHVRNPGVEESFSICRQGIPTTEGSAPTPPITVFATKAPTSVTPKPVTPTIQASTFEPIQSETTAASFPESLETGAPMDPITVAPVTAFTSQAPATGISSSEAPASGPSRLETPTIQTPTFEPPGPEAPFTQFLPTEDPITEAPSAETPVPFSTIQASTFEPLRTLVPETPFPQSSPTEASRTNGPTAPSDKCLTDKAQRCVDFINLARLHAGQRTPNGMLCLFLKRCTEEQVLCSGFSLIENSSVTSDCGFLPFLASILIPRPSITTAALAPRFPTTPFPTVVVPISEGSETPVTSGFPFPTQTTKAPGSPGPTQIPEMTSVSPVTYTILAPTEELLTPGTTKETPVLPSDVPQLPSVPSGLFTTPTSETSTIPEVPAKKREFSWLENWYSIVPKL